MPPRAAKSGTAAVRTGPGRPRVHTETWNKVSVVLFERQLRHLDRLANKARRRGHKSVTRASLIRGLIDGVLSGGIDLSRHPSEAHLRDDIAARLRAASRRL